MHQGRVYKPFTKGSMEISGKWLVHSTHAKAWGSSRPPGCSADHSALHAGRSPLITHLTSGNVSSSCSKDGFCLQNYESQTLAFDVYLQEPYIDGMYRVQSTCACTVMFTLPGPFPAKICIRYQKKTELQPFAGNCSAVSQTTSC